MTRNDIRVLIALWIVSVVVFVIGIFGASLVVVGVGAVMIAVASLWTMSLLR
jgi:hypothetical protein